VVVLLHFGGRKSSSKFKHQMYAKLVPSHTVNWEKHKSSHCKSLSFKNTSYERKKKQEIKRMKRSIKIHAEINLKNDKAITNMNVNRKFSEA
jgi:hypothetical protein